MRIQWLSSEYFVCNLIILPVHRLLANEQTFLNDIYAYVCIMGPAGFLSEVCKPRQGRPSPKAMMNFPLFLIPPISEKKFPIGFSAQNFQISSAIISDDFFD